MDKPIITIRIVPSPLVENTYSVTLERLNKEDLLFLYKISGNVVGSTENSPRRITDALYDNLREIFKRSLGHLWDHGANIIADDYGTYKS